MKKLKIAIVGAGIGGLTTALFLEKIGFSAHIYEQSSSIKPIGAGIILAHNAMQVYQKLDLDKEIAALGNTIASTNLTNTKLKILSTLDIKGFDKKYSTQSVAILRSHLQKISLEKLDTGKIHLSKTLQSLTEGPLVELVFSDGSTERYDAVIAADGINSTVRKNIFPENTIRDAKQICWRGIANISLPPKYHNQFNEAWGKASRFGFVKISPDEVYWYSLINNTNQSGKNIAEYFSKYHPIINSIISNTNSQNIFRNDIYDLKPISSWSKANICLLGDAAHATTPNLGQGACQAIEDAYVLSHFIDTQPINIAFKQYEVARIKKAHMVTNLSWRLGKVAQLNNPILSVIRNTTMRLIPNSLNKKQSDKIFSLPNI